MQKLERKSLIKKNEVAGYPLILMIVSLLVTKLTIAGFPDSVTMGKLVISL